MLAAIVSTGIFTGLCTILCLWASALAREARAQQRFPVQRLNAAEAELADLRDRMERLHAFVKRLNAREASQAARDSKRGPRASPGGTFAQLPDESDAEWKARMRSHVLPGLGRGGTPDG